MTDKMEAKHAVAMIIKRAVCGFCTARKKPPRTDTSYTPVNPARINEFTAHYCGGLSPAANFMEMI